MWVTTSEPLLFTKSQTQFYSFFGSFRSLIRRITDAVPEKTDVVSKLKCPVFLAREMSGFDFTKQLTIQ